MALRYVACGLFFVVALAGSAQAQIVRYVDDDAPSGGDGLTWSMAYDDVQDALTEALGDPSITEIRVASGTYVPSIQTEPGVTRTEAFQLINGVTLSGGYRGCPDGDCLSGDPDERDIALYESVLSGDLNGDDTAVACAQDSPDCDSHGDLCVDKFCIIKQNNDENSHHVFYHPGARNQDETAVLDGFTITGGNASASGGGMCNHESSPTVSNCTFSGNSGDGMYNSRNTPTVTNCTFSGNDGSGMLNAEYSTPTVTDCTFNENSGGGMRNSFHGNPTVTNCTFSENSVMGTSAKGGGMCNEYSSSPTVTNCTFSGNSTEGAFSEGGGMYNDHFGSNPTVVNCTFNGNSTNGAVSDGGGGMYNAGWTTTVVRCTFSGNSARYGGGMYNSSNISTVTDCTFCGNYAREQGGGMFNSSSSPTVTNCTFSENAATVPPYPGGGARGGGMYNNNSSPAVTNCTFSGNYAWSGGGGIYNYDYSGPTVTNCTFSGNKASNGRAVACDSVDQQYPSTVLIANCILWDDGYEVWNYDGSTISVTFSSVQDDEPDDGVVYPGTGNIDADPLFVDPGYWDDNGTPSHQYDDFWVDGDYHLQMSSPCINAGDNNALTDDAPTDLDGHARILCAVVDMGAYEFGIGDYECDDDVDLDDFAAWEACMTGPDSGPYDADCEAFDFEFNGDVDLRDFSRFQAVFEGPAP